MIIALTIAYWACQIGCMVAVQKKQYETAVGIAFTAGMIIAAAVVEMIKN